METTIIGIIFVGLSRDLELLVSEGGVLGLGLRA